MDADGVLVGEARRMLQVKPGRCGLQQSEMVFQHTRSLPDILEELLGRGSFAAALAGIGVSVRPRPQADSYMPAFLPGACAARSLAACTGARLHRLSHQENHLEAALWSAGGPVQERFLMLHASGGTTELLLAERRADGSFGLRLAGGSSDLHAGQFVDRVGVALGLRFPCGPALEELAASAGTMVDIPVAVQRTRVSFAGPATAAMRLVQGGADGAAVALGVQHALAEAFARLLRNGAEACGVDSVLLAGGVAANDYIRRHVAVKLAKKGVRCYFPEPRFSGDNACGCAAFARRMGEKDDAG